MMILLINHQILINKIIKIKIYFNKNHNLKKKYIKIKINERQKFLRIKLNCKI